MRSDQDVATTTPGVYKGSMPSSARNGDSWLKALSEKQDLTDPHKVHANWKMPWTISKEHLQVPVFPREECVHWMNQDGDWLVNGEIVRMPVSEALQKVPSEKREASPDSSPPGQESTLTEASASTEEGGEPRPLTGEVSPDSSPSGQESTLTEASASTEEGGEPRPLEGEESQGRSPTGQRPIIPSPSTDETWSAGIVFPAFVHQGRRMVILYNGEFFMDLFLEQDDPCELEYVEYQMKSNATAVIRRTERTKHFEMTVATSRAVIRVNAIVGEVHQRGTLLCTEQFGPILIKDNIFSPFSPINVELVSDLPTEGLFGPWVGNWELNVTHKKRANKQYSSAIRQFDGLTVDRAAWPQGFRRLRGLSIKNVETDQVELCSKEMPNQRIFCPITKLLSYDDPTAVDALVYDADLTHSSRINCVMAGDADEITVRLGTNAKYY